MSNNVLAVYAAMAWWNVSLCKVRASSVINQRKRSHTRQVWVDWQRWRSVGFASRLLWWRNGAWSQRKDAWVYIACIPYWRLPIDFYELCTQLLDASFLNFLNKTILTPRVLNNLRWFRFKERKKCGKYRNSVTTYISLDKSSLYDCYIMSSSVVCCYHLLSVVVCWRLLRVVRPDTWLCCNQRHWTGNIGVYEISRFFLSWNLAREGAAFRWRSLTVSSGEFGPGHRTSHIGQLLPSGLWSAKSKTLAGRE